jgi:membrane-bound lytic murein transglycosylase B
VQSLVVVLRPSRILHPISTPGAPRRALRSVVSVVNPAATRHSCGRKDLLLGLDHGRGVKRISSTSQAAPGPRHGNSSRGTAGIHRAAVTVAPAGKHGTIRNGGRWTTPSAWGLAAAVAALTVLLTTTNHALSVPVNTTAARDTANTVDEMRTARLTVPGSSTAPSGAAGVWSVASLDAPPATWLAVAASRQPASVGSTRTAAVVAPSIPAAYFDSGAIPHRALAAYVSAASAEALAAPECHLTWPVLAGIGLIESDHARSGGSAKPNWPGISSPPILGPLLDGSGGYPAVYDTDDGVLDGNTTFDRAVGPMQFLPSTWREYARPESDGSPGNPENIVDAAAATGRYLCASGVDLRTSQGLIAAVYGYNHSFDYVTEVVSAASRYGSGTLAGAAAALAALPALEGQPPSSPSSSPSPTPSAPKAAASKDATSDAQQSPTTSAAVSASPPAASTDAAPGTSSFSWLDSPAPVWSVVVTATPTPVESIPVSSSPAPSSSVFSSAPATSSVSSAPATPISSSLAASVPDSGAPQTP